MTGMQITLCIRCPKRELNATHKVFQVVELREMILAHLPLEDLYRCKRVCYDWLESIVGSCALAEAMYIHPMKGRRSRIKWMHEVPEADTLLSRPRAEVYTTPIVFNPILNRKIIIPKEESFEIFARLEPRRSADAEDAVDLLENVLESEPFGDASAFLRLVKGAERPIKLFHMVQGIIQDRPDERSTKGSKTPVQPGWKNMFLSQPPITQLLIEHPRRRNSCEVHCVIGLRMYDILRALQDLSAPESWEEGCDLASLAKDVRMLLPLESRHGTPALFGGCQFFRATKTGLNLRFESGRTQ